VGVIVSDEESFVKTCATDSFDILISDADHYYSMRWLDHHLRIVRPGGILFFHDTNNHALFPELATLEQSVRELGLPYRHFTLNNRPTERCDRGATVRLQASPGARCHATSFSVSTVGSATWKVNPGLLAMFSYSAIPSILKAARTSFTEMPSRHGSRRAVFPMYLAGRKARRNLQRASSVPRAGSSAPEAQLFKLERHTGHSSPDRADKNCKPHAVLERGCESVKLKLYTEPQGHI